MHILDVIEAKRDGKTLTREQISFFVKGVADEAFPDYQISAFLMAAFLRGLDDAETAFLTHEMAVTGDTVDLSFAGGTVVDKHSSGGVGDKTTLAVAPIAAACGLKVAKMSGRGLGFTGGTLDKLESVPGFRINLSPDEFAENVRRDGISVVGQTAHVAPVDKKLYKLRDVTGTVPSIPLIAASIMSKKLAFGSDAIVLDVKAGSGAFMKSGVEAVELAQKMVAIGEANGRRTVALVTGMEHPLGRAVGNSLEVVEAVETLRGNGPEDFVRLCEAISAEMLLAGGVADGEDAALDMVRNAVDSGAALAKLRLMIGNQGGDTAYIDDPGLFRRADCIEPLVLPNTGYVKSIDTEAVGRASVALGAGRYTAEQSVDHAAGIIVCKKIGEYIGSGEPVAFLHTDEQQSLIEARAMLEAAYALSDEPVTQPDVVMARVDVGGVKWLRQI